MENILPVAEPLHAVGKFSPQFFPKLQGIQQLFAQVITAASLWVHLLSVNLFAARHAYLQGATICVSELKWLHLLLAQWWLSVWRCDAGLCDQSPVQHSIFLSMFFGPFGMLSHFLTQVQSCHLPSHSRQHSLDVYTAHNNWLLANTEAASCRRCRECF